MRTQPRTVLILLLGLCLPYLIYAAHRAEESVENRSDDWLPPHFQETQQLRWLENVFGGDELLMISYPGCDLNDQRLSIFADELRQLRTSGKPLFRRVITGSEILEQLTNGGSGISPNVAIRRLTGWVVGHEGQTCAVAMISNEGKQDRAAALNEVLRVAEVSGLPRDSLKMAGATMESVAINRTSTQWYLELTLLSLVICALLMFISLRSAAITLMVFGTAMISERLSLAWMYISGTPTDSVSTMTPALVYVLAISTGVHLANYYRDEVASGSLRLAPGRAARNAWKPCLMATLTTALGLGSLLLSDLTPVQRFGMFSAIGVLGMLAVQFLVLPFLLERFPPRAWAARMTDMEHSDPLHGVWRGLANWIESRHAVVAALGLTLFIVGALGVGQLRATARLHNLLPSDASVLRDYAWLETQIGPLVPLEVVLRFPADNSSSMVERAQLVEQVERAVASTPDTGRAISATTWLPPLPKTNGGLRSIFRRTVANRRLNSRREALAKTEMFCDSADEELWRISAAANASDESLDYAQLMRRIATRVDPLIDDSNVATGGNVTAVYTGGIPLMHKIQSQLLDDLVKSFLAALGVITLVMILVLRSIPAGLLAMIPNVLPTVIIFGSLGWLGPPIEVGSLMTAGAAIGIAVDDTLHFMTWFQRGLQQGLNRCEAVRFAYRSCATAMLQTSLICGLGLLVFAVSPFVPIARFGWMLAALLSAALLGDLVILPAILVGPLGKVFRVSVSHNEASQTPRQLDHARHIASP